MTTGPEREKTLTVCKGFWDAYGGREGEVVERGCGDMGTIVSQRMRGPGGTVLHEFL